MTSKPDQVYYCYDLLSNWSDYSYTGIPGSDITASVAPATPPQPQLGSAGRNCRQSNRFSSSGRPASGVLQQRRESRQTGQWR